MKKFFNISSRDLTHAFHQANFFLVRSAGQREFTPDSVSPGFFPSRTALPSIGNLLRRAVQAMGFAPAS
jgi:hypothetical protein